MPVTLSEHAGLPLAARAVFRLERTEDGMWLADDPEVECYAEGADPTAAIAALLDAEREYLGLLSGASARSDLMEQHLQILLSRVG